MFIIHSLELVHVIIYFILLHLEICNVLHYHSCSKQSSSPEIETSLCIFKLINPLELTPAINPQLHILAGSARLNEILLNNL